MVPRIYSQNYAVRLSVILLFLFASITSFGQAPPQFDNCPISASVDLPDGGGTVTFTNTNIPAIFGVVASDPDMAEIVVYSASPTFVNCTNAGAVVNVTITATDSDGSNSSCIIPLTVNDIGPQAVCMNITVALDGMGAANIAAADIDGGSYNCAGGGPGNPAVLTMRTIDGAANQMYGCADIGTFPVTLEVTDANGSSTCLAMITIEDNMAPTVTAGAQGNIAQNNDAGMCSAVVNYVDPTFDDNCGGVGQAGMLTAGMASGSMFPVGTTTVTYSFTDAGGNMVSHDFDVTVTDIEAPTVTMMPLPQGNIAIGTNSPTLCGAVVSYTVPTFDDNCGGTGQFGIRTAGLASGTTFPLGITTVTHTFTDAGGAMASHSFDVVVSDDDAPTVATTTSNINMVNDPGNCSAIITYTAPTFNDNCDGMGLAGTLTAGLASGSAFPVGTTTVTYSFTDAAGNGPITSSFDVTVTDDEAPDAAAVNPGNMTVNNDAGTCQASVSWLSVLAGDNCPGATTVVYSTVDPKMGTVDIFTGVQNGDLVDFGDFPVGTTTVTYTITDLAGNSDMGTFTVTVFDNEAPNVLYPSGIVLNYANCNSDVVVPNYGFLTNVDDNCTGYTIIQSPAPGTLVSSLATLATGETFSVTITVTDNFPSATNMGDSDNFLVTLNEENTPVPNLPGAVLDPISGTCGPLVVDAPYAVDECGNTICGVPFPLPAGTINLGPTCGASGGPCSNVSRDIPIIAIPDGNTTGVNIPIEFTESGIVEEIEIDLNINHTWVGDLIVTLTDPDGNSMVIFDRPGAPPGTLGCSNSDLAVTFSSSGADHSVFEATCNSSSPAISGSFQPSDPFSVIISNNVDAKGIWELNISDNAGLDVGTTAAGSLLSLCIQDNNSTATPDYLFPVGNHNITWNYDAGNGNIVSQQQSITVAEDTQGPDLSCQDITIVLDADGDASIVSDELVAVAGIELSGSNLTPCFNPVADTETDFSISVSSDITVSFDWDYFTFDGPAFDPFGYAIDGTFVAVTNPGGGTSQSGSTTVSLTAGQTFAFRAYTDDNTCGNSITQITNFSPGFSGEYSISNWSLTNTNGGVGDITDILDGIVTDNCSDPADITLSLSQTNFNCNDVGDNTVTLTATDEEGNSSQCSATVTVVDMTAPLLTNIPANVTVDCNAIPAPPSIGTGAGQIDATDACGTLGVIFNQTSTQLTNSALCGFYNYQITRTWSVSDASGNLTEESQVITVQDNQGPIFASTNFPNTVSANASAGSCSAFVSLQLTAAGVLDLPGCVSFANLTITNNGNGAGTANASGTYPVGSTPVTFTVTDPCGNSNTYTVSVNVNDNTPPIAACNSISIGIPDGQDSIIIDASLIALINNGSFDNCAGTAVDLSVSPNVFYCSDIADGTQSVFDITLAVVVPGSMDTSFCETTITIQDNNDPNITCVDPLVITLGADGTATATADLLNGGIDDCSDIMTIELIGNTNFDINDIGSHPISDGITPTLQVTDVHGNVETCTPTTLIVTPPTTCLTSADLIANGQVEIPYTSTNFTNVIGFQFSMQVDDETVATFAQDDAANLCGGVTINVPNLSGVNQALICNGTFTNQISPDGKVLSVSWFNTSPDPISIPNGETLFNFRLDALGVVGDMTTFSITGVPFTNELTTKYGNDILTDTPPLCVDPIGIFEVGDNATLPISGNVSTWSKTRIDTIGFDTISMMPLVTNPILDTVVLVAGQGLNNASMVKIETMLPSGTPVTTDTDMTDANGDYTVQVANVAGGVSIDLVPRKNNPNWLNNGDVSSSDLFFIQQHIVNNIPFVSIYEYIAADVNQSGTITTLDLVLIQDVIVNPELAPVPSSVIDAYSPWRFIQREYAETNLNPFDLDPSIPLPSQPMAPVIPSNAQNRFYNPAMLPMTDVDWVAVKIGQVFGGLNTNTLTNNDVDSRTGENLVMSVENQKVRNGDLISIPVYAKDYAAFIAWQFTLEFDVNHLAYEGMIPGAIAGFEENKLGLNSVEEGIIGAVWYGTPNNVKSDEVLFTLQFTALDDADALSGLIDITSRTVKSESSLLSGATGEVSLTFFSPTVTTTTDFELHQNRPNPFNEETLISFNLPEAGFARVTISDISGRTLKVVEGDYAKGYNEVRIQSNDLSSTGVLYYQLESAEHIATKKMIILE